MDILSFIIEWMENPSNRACLMRVPCDKFESKSSTQFQLGELLKRHCLIHHKNAHEAL